MYLYHPANSFDYSIRMKENPKISMEERPNLTNTILISVSVLLHLHLDIFILKFC